VKNCGLNLRYVFSNALAVARSVGSTWAYTRVFGRMPIVVIRESNDLRSAGNVAGAA
jgi:hypothetical protein